MATGEGFDQEVDVLVVGAGAAGMTAALTAKAAGLDALLIEKSHFYGGSTAMSGGGIWAPGAPEIVRNGFHDSPERVLTYLEAITGGDVPVERLRRYAEATPELFAFLERQSEELRFEWKPKYPDYFPQMPGGSVIGRSINAQPIDLRRLGNDARHMRPSNLTPPKGMWIRTNELYDFYGLKRSWRGKLVMLRMVARMIRATLTGRQMVAGGQSLIARLRLALGEADVPLWLDAPLHGLISDDDGKVVGAEVERAGDIVRVGARGGIILTTGGFDHNAEMRRTYQSLESDWSLGNPEATGDGIRIGEGVGAALDLMDDAWWMPSISWPDGRMTLLLNEMMIPGQIVVNGAGRRFVNEAAPYTEFCHAVLAGEKTGVTHIPSWLIIDEESWRNYVFAGHLPIRELPAPVPTGQALPEAWVDAGIVEVANDWDELARRIGVPPEALGETVERFNRFANQAYDEDFHRGENAYNNYYGDPRFPNPNLRELRTPPFYAFRIVPGDLGTKGGLVTDADARVLRPDGTAIEGLFASGNVSASVMAHSYAGAGATIGPAMTFAFVAARHIASALVDGRVKDSGDERARASL